MWCSKVPAFCSPVQVRLGWITKLTYSRDGIEAGHHLGGVITKVLLSMESQASDVANDFSCIKYPNTPAGVDRSLLTWPWKSHYVIFPVLYWLHWFQVSPELRVGDPQCKECRII